MQLVTIGKIAGTHHLKGAVKIIFYIDEPISLVNQKVIISKNKILTISKISHLVKDRYIVEFNEITSKTDAEQLAGKDIEINRDLLDLQEDEYLTNDLLGMEVIDINTNLSIGKVIDIMEIPLYEILEIEDDTTQTTIPNIPTFVKNIDFEKNIISVDLLDGMQTPKNSKSIQDDGLSE